MSFLSQTNTPFKPDKFHQVQSGCTRWSSLVWKQFFFIPGESLIEPDELLSKSYPPRTLLANQKFIGVHLWFSGNKSGLKGFPMNTDENADEVLGTTVKVHYFPGHAMVTCMVLASVCWAENNYTHIYLHVYQCRPYHIFAHVKLAYCSLYVCNHTTVIDLSSSWFLV